MNLVLVELKNLVFKEDIAIVTVKVAHCREALNCCGRRAVTLIDTTDMLFMNCRHSGAPIEGGLQGAQGPFRHGKPCRLL